MIKIALIEDFPPVVEMLQNYFSKEGSFDLLFCADSVQKIPMHKVAELDIVLCDIGLPNKSGIEATWLLKQKNPRLHVVMFTVFEDEGKIFQSLQAGASGYLLKDTPLPKIKQGLLEVLKGGAPISPAVAKKVIAYFQNSPKKEVAGLTERESEILGKIQSGKTNHQVAALMGISTRTVKFHNRNIYKKLHIKGRAELYKYFGKSGAL